jgi:hypothetical protein
MMGQVNAWECGLCKKLVRDIFHIRIECEGHKMTLEGSVDQPIVSIDRCIDCLSGVGKEAHDALQP